MLEQGKACFILWNPSLWKPQEKQGNFHQKYLCFSSRQVTQAISWDLFHLSIKISWFWWYFLCESYGVFWESEALKPDCHSSSCTALLCIKNNILYFLLFTEKLGNLPIFLWPKLCYKGARSPISEGEEKKKEEYSWWNRSLVSVSIKNKQRIFLQMSLPILIYVLNFAYFAILGKKEKLEEHMENQEKFEHPQGNRGLGTE